MKITNKDVKYVAELSKLSFSEAECTEMASHLENIVGHFNMLNSVDTSKVDATAHILDSVNVLRKDEAKPSQDRSKLLANAPESNGECYIVPKVLD